MTIIKSAELDNSELSSAGHRFGQIIGDWWEQHVAYPILKDVAENLELYVDCRFSKRACRGDKIQWTDSDGNIVDYDFVLELGGTNEKLGIPVAFIETFWRRGARHSKDKARDDSGKLIPMRNTFPTARFLGIFALGDFTAPAKQYVSSRDIKLFYVPKQKALEAFRDHKLEIDYADKLSETDKWKLLETFEKGFTDDVKAALDKTLREKVGLASFKSYQNEVVAALSAQPQEIRIVRSRHGEPVIFSNLHAAGEFLGNPQFSEVIASTTYKYWVQYSDGTDFEREIDNLENLRQLHDQLAVLADHMEKLAQKS